MEAPGATGPTHEAVTSSLWGLLQLSKRLVNMHCGGVLLPSRLWTGRSTEVFGPHPAGVGICTMPPEFGSVPILEPCAGSPTVQFFHPCNSCCLLSAPLSIVTAGSPTIIILAKMRIIHMVLCQSLSAAWRSRVLLLTRASGGARAPPPPRAESIPPDIKGLHIHQPCENWNQNLDHLLLSACHLACCVRAFPSEHGRTFRACMSPRMLWSVCQVCPASVLVTSLIFATLNASALHHGVQSHTTLCTTVFFVVIHMCMHLHC
jgi:hypothetical protein